MAFSPIISVVDETTGLDSTVLHTVLLKPFGSAAGQINCSRLGSTHRYLADSAIDETKAYHVTIDGTKKGMIFDDNVVPDKTSFAEAF